MSADVIDLKLHGQSAAGEIGGERITLSEPTGITSLDYHTETNGLKAVSLVNYLVQVLGGGAAQASTERSRRKAQGHDSSSDRDLS